jgi:DNA invertase Pin-like site-specific DNA recombinase
MIFGYARVSTVDQKLDRQIDALKEARCENIFTEKITGTKKERPELQKLLDQLRKDDIMVITDLTRLSRSTKDLLELVGKLQEIGVGLKSLKEQWLDTSSAHGKLLLTIFSSLSQFERDVLSERTKEGLSSARARGKVGGRKKANKKKVDAALKMYDSRIHTISEITELTGLSKATIYRKIQERTRISS